MSESLWTLEDGVLHIQLAKAQADTTWASAIAGHELRADQQQEDQKRLLLERFQQEVRVFRGDGSWSQCQHTPRLQQQSLLAPVAALGPCATAICCGSRRWGKGCKLQHSCPSSPAPCPPSLAAPRV